MTNLTPAAVAALSDEELNKACAEKVMEWEYIAQGCGWYARKGDGYAYQCAVFSPATSIGDAAQCTERVLAKGVHFTIKLLPGMAEVTVWHDGYPRFMIQHVTEPRARAEASLLAALKENE
jgi:hypothetical protein